MNTRDFFNSLSERQQVVSIIVLAGLALAVLWFSLLWPLSRRRMALEQEIEGMKVELARSNYLLGEMPLRHRKLIAEHFGQALSGEWRLAAERLSTFSDQEVSEERDVSTIDFKVALFEVRERLRQKAAEQGIRSSFELGIDEKVLSNEDARKRMLQLRAVERLVDLALDLKIPRIEQVEPLEPAKHRVAETGDVYMEEYPVRITFSGTLPHCYELLRAVLRPERVFVFRRLRIEKEAGEKPDAVRVDATLSALVFLREPEDLKAVAPAAPRVARPLGH
jgi:hypothetical protein